MIQAPAGALAAALLLCANAAQAAAPPVRAKDPRGPVAAANAAARVQPQPETFQGAVQKFAWTDGGLYQVYGAPGRITDIVLEPGEQLIGPGPVAAGDTARWIIGDTESGAQDRRRVHVLVKPTQANLATNLIINTDRRTYYLELRASATTYMASVAWTYPKDAVLALTRPAPPPIPAASSPAPVGLAFSNLNFDYRLTGDRAPWRPSQVFDDGAKVYLIFPANIATGDLPPLFLLDAAGQAELVNYRLEGRRMIVERLFDRAELRLGTKRKARRVRIERLGAAGR